MMKWHESKLSEQTEIFSGFAFKSDDLTIEDTGLPVIKIAQIQNKQIQKDVENYFPSEKYTNRLDKYRLRRKDTVIAMTGAGSVGKVGRMNIVDRDYLVNQRVAIIRSKSKQLNEDYLYYFLTQDYIERSLYDLGLGAGQPNISSADIGRIDFYLPPEPIQKKIGAMLSAYDDLMEINNRRIAILEKMAEDLYREWFVRLRFPGHEKVKIIKGVPESWEVKKLPEIAEITYGHPFDGSRFNDLGIGKPIIRIRNIPDSSTTDYTDEEAKDKHVVRKGDLLVGMDGEFHINHWFGEEAYLVQRSCRIKSYDPLLHGYLSKAIVAPVKFYESILQGATVGHLGAKHLNSVDILIPNSEFKSCFTVFNNLVQQKVNYSSSNNNLKLSRNLLLLRLMSGKIDIKNMDIEFPASMKEELVHA